MNLQRRVRDARHEQRRELDESDDVCVTVQADVHRSPIAAIDAAIHSVAGRATMSSAEVVDLLLDLRSRIAFSAILTDAWDG